MDNPPIEYPTQITSILNQIKRVIPIDRPLYLVGGIVRDIIVRRAVRDIDFVLPDAALDTARNVANQLNAAFYPLDAERETGRVILTDETGKKWHLDFSTFRGEDLEADLKARDFTVNAIAIDTRDPYKLLDPLGGVLDLRYGILRTCSTTSFADDPIRLIRAVRMATSYDLKILPETLQGMRQVVCDLEKISFERLRDELFRILEDHHAASCIRLLKMVDGISYILPELDELQGLEQSPPHIADVWTHTLDAVNRLEELLAVLDTEYHPDLASNIYTGLVALRLGRYRTLIAEQLRSELSEGRSLRALLFFAVLYHDVGKPMTQQTDPSGRIRYLDHDRIGIERVSNRARKLHLSNAEIDWLNRVVRNHMRPLLLAQSGNHPSRRAIYRFFRDTGEAGVAVCLIALADVWATYGPTLPHKLWESQLNIIRELLDAWWSEPEISVSPPVLLDGRELISALSIQPGPIVGMLLEEIREAQADGQVQNRDQALDLARSILVRIPVDNK